jgi:hypothetical protein
MGFFQPPHPDSCPMVLGARTPGVKRPGCEADHSTPSGVDVKNAWHYTSTPQYVLMTWCLIKKLWIFMVRYLVKHRDNFSLAIEDGSCARRERERELLSCGVAVLLVLPCGYTSRHIRRRVLTPRNRQRFHLPTKRRRGKYQGRLHILCKLKTSTSFSEDSYHYRYQ